MKLSGCIPPFADRWHPSACFLPDIIGKVCSGGAQQNVFKACQTWEAGPCWGRTLDLTINQYFWFCQTLCWVQLNVQLVAITTFTTRTWSDGIHLRSGLNPFTYPSESHPPQCPAALNIAGSKLSPLSRFSGTLKLLPQISRHKVRCCAAWHLLYRTAPSYHLMPSTVLQVLAATRCSWWEVPRHISHACSCSSWNCVLPPLGQNPAFRHLSSVLPSQNCCGDTVTSHICAISFRSSMQEVFHYLQGTKPSLFMWWLFQPPLMIY